MQNSDQFSPGAILVAVWGYDQTNMDFYQVVSRTEKTAIIQEIESDSYTCLPLKNRFRGEPMRRKVKDDFIRINDVVFASPYEGESYAVDALAYR